MIEGAAARTVASSRTPLVDARVGSYWDLVSKAAMRSSSAGYGDRVAASRSALTARRSAATVGRLAEALETAVGTSVGDAGVATELRGWTGSVPCILADDAIDEVDGVAVAEAEPDASHVTETLPDAVVIDAVAPPSLQIVAVTVAGGVVSAAVEAALLALSTR